MCNKFIARKCDLVKNVIQLFLTMVSWQIPNVLMTGFPPNFPNFLSITGLPSNFQIFF